MTVETQGGIPKNPGELITIPWWLKYPKLVVNNDLHVMQRKKGEGVDSTEIAKVNEAIQPILQTMVKEFRRAGCQTVVLSDGEPAKKEMEVTLETSPYVIAVNPVFLGVLPNRVQSAMETYQTEPNDAHLLTMRRTFKRYLPEEKRPLLARIGKRLFRRLGNQDELKEGDQNFVNMILVKDPDGRIGKLPDQGKPFFDWSLMSKVGSFKEIIIAYRMGASGVEFVHEPILGTFEGGHPFMEPVALGQQLVALGSTRSVGSAEELKNINPIPRLQWQRSKVVNALKQLGSYLGKRDLLSPPIAIDDMVRGDKLGRFLKMFAKFSRQAEGAFMIFEPEIQTDAVEVPWTGVPIVTCSGKFGAIKAKLSYNDLVATIPVREPGTEAKVVWLPVKKRSIKRIIKRITRQKLQGPSVEAEEFTHPLLELSLENPEKYLLKLQKVEGGYRKSSEGNRKVPPVRGVIHLHRDTSIRKGVEDMFEIDTSMYPAFGCGVDAMQEMSRQVMKKAVDMWIDRGCKDKAAIFEAADHGYGIILFWTPDQNGIIPEKPAAQLEEAIEKGNLVFARDVHQRHNWRVLDPYYAQAT